MKKSNLILALIPLLASCGGDNIAAEQFVDPDFIPTLPEFVNKNNGAIKEDETNVYFDFYELSDFHGATTYGEGSQLGISKLASYFDDKRLANPGGSIILAGGDMWQGTADSNITRGNLVTYAMCEIGFDSMTLGNHEFDWTDTWIKNNKNRANFPFLCANLIDKTTSTVADFVLPSTVVERGNYKIGIIGTIGENIKDAILASAVKNFDFADEIETVKSETQKLRDDGCDIVVWSSHNDIDYLKNRMNGQNLDVDLVFGGHSHSVLTSTVDEIPLLETNDLGRSVAHAQLAINKETKQVSVVKSEVDSNLFAKQYQNNANIDMIYSQYNERYINPVKNQKLGKASGDFDERSLANFAVEAMYKKVHELYPDLDTKAAFTNVNGGIRNTLRNGNITYGDIYSVFPFDNEIVIMETTGKKLNNYCAGNLNNAAFYQEVYEYGVLTSSGKYLFITTDYLASNSGYFLSAGDVKVYTKITVRDCVAEAIRNQKTIKADEYKTNAKNEFKPIK